MVGSVQEADAGLERPVRSDPDGPSFADGDEPEQQMGAGVIRGGELVADDGPVAHRRTAMTVRGLARLSYFDRLESRAGVLAHVVPEARHAVHQPFRLQHAQRFAGGLSGDPMLLGQAGDRRYGMSWAEFA